MSGSGAVGGVISARAQRRQFETLLSALALVKETASAWVIVLVSSTAPVGPLPTKCS